MAVISFSNGSLMNSNLPFDMHCLITRPGSFVFIAYGITNIFLLLPLCILVLFIGLQRWRQQRSTSTAAMMSHSDSFTYHMVIVELIGIIGCTSCLCSIYFWGNVKLLHMGYFLWNLTWYGETFFHILTCVERYLAVVHPVTYLSLKRERGIRIRNISIGCTWLLCIGAKTLGTSEVAAIFFDSILSIFSLIVVTFCSLSVLCVLIRPGPGEQGGNRDRVDQSKQRAFYTLMAILGVLLLRSLANLLFVVLYGTMGIGECVEETANIWINLPSSLVLPLLFLQRAGRVICCKYNT